MYCSFDNINENIETHLFEREAGDLAVTRQTQQVGLEPIWDRKQTFRAWTNFTQNILSKLSVYVQNLFNDS